MYNLKTKLKDHHGKDIDQTYGEIIAEILLATVQTDQPNNKYRYFTLALKAVEKEELELDKETVEFIMEKVTRIGAPLIVGRLKEFLEIKEPSE